MQIEEYFNFIDSNDIRLKDSRIGIETILYEYLYARQHPEAIAQLYPTITLEQVYATILYFLHNQAEVTRYMANWLNYCEESAQKQDENPPEYVIKLRKMQAQKIGSHGVSLHGCCMI